jgi:hypothetical protein
MQWRSYLSPLAPLLRSRPPSFHNRLLPPSRARARSRDEDVHGRRPTDRRGVPVAALRSRSGRGGRGGGAYARSVALVVRARRCGPILVCTTRRGAAILRSRRASLQHGWRARAVDL